MAFSLWLYAGNAPTTFLIAALLILFTFWSLMLKKTTQGPDPTKCADFIKYLNPIERLFACMHDRGNSILNFTVVFKSETKLSLDLINQSTVLWMKFHRILRARIMSHNEFYRYAYFVESDPQDLTRLPVEEVRVSDWKILFEEELLKPFNSTGGLLWKLKFIPAVNTGFANDVDSGSRTHYADATPPYENYDTNKYEHILMFRFLHCFTDGIGAVCLIKDFIHVLNTVLTGKPLDIKDRPQAPDIYTCVRKPSFRQAIGMWLLSQPLPFTSKILERMIKRPNFPEASDNPMFGVGVKNAGKLRINVVQLEERETSSLRQACKGRGCTIQGVIEASLGLVISQAISVYQSRKSKNISVNMNVPINMRPWLQNPAISSTVVGNYFGDTGHALVFDPLMSKEKMAEMATSITTRLRTDTDDAERLVSCLGHGPMGLIDKFITIWDTVSDGIHRTGRNSNDVLISNLGICSCLEYEAMKAIHPMAMFWSLSMLRMGAAWFVHCITCGGRMTITITTEQTIVPKEHASDVCKCLGMILRGFST